MKFEPSLAAFKCRKNPIGVLRGRGIGGQSGGRLLRCQTLELPGCAVAFAIKATKNIYVSRRIYIKGESIDAAIPRLTVAHREQLRMNVLLHSYHESALLRRFKGGRPL